MIKKYKLTYIISINRIIITKHKFKNMKVYINLLNLFLRLIIRASISVIIKSKFPE